MELLKNTTATPMIAVSDIERAKKFYQDTLELPIEPMDMDGMFLCKSGATSFIVYTSDYAGSNKANVFVWSLGEAFDTVFEVLRTKNVNFEIYPEIEGVKVEGKVHRYGTDKLAWFKDPDGNLFHIRT